jgi:hypothetical protein
MTARSLIVAAVALAVLAQSGCGLQAKKDDTARIVGAADLTMKLPRYDAVLESSIRPHHVNGRSLKQHLGNRASAIRAFPLPGASVALDLRIKRSVVLPRVDAAKPVGAAPGAPPDAGPPGLANASNLIAGSVTNMPLAIAFSEWDIFVRPSPLDVAAGSGVQAGTGTWLWLDVGAIDPDQETNLAAPTPVLMLPPHVLVLLLEGALTGSVERLGNEQVGDVETTHYRFNISRDKAADNLDDDDTQRLDRLFEAANIDGAFYDDAEVWIDEEGIARRIQITLPQRIDALTSFELSYRLELTVPRSEPLPLPTNDDLAEVPTLPELLPGVGA